MTTAASVTPGSGDHSSHSALDLDALEAVAKAATPSEYMSTSGHQEWLRHFAAFDPPTALALIHRVREVEAERDIAKANERDAWTVANARLDAYTDAIREMIAREQLRAAAEATITRIRELLEAPSDERGITWWEWIDGGLGGSLHDDLRRALEGES